MKIKLTKALVGVFAFTLLSACNSNEDAIMVQKSVDKSDISTTDYFSVNYIYSDTIKVYNGKDYVTIVLSSDKRDVLDAHMAKNKYVLSEVVGVETFNNKSNSPEAKSDFAGQNSGFIQCEISNMPKIRMEILEKSDSIKTFEIKCKSKEIISKSGVQKVPFYPTPTYYEYTSPGGKYYGKLKYTNVDDYGYTNQPTKVRYGYQSCWLFCGWTSWPANYFRTLNYWDIGYLYDINAFGRDGDNYTGYSIYRLCTGIISYSPYNHECHWGIAPVGNW